MTMKRHPLLVASQVHPEYTTLPSTLRYLVEKDGIARLWAGITPRAFRIASAVVILQTVRGHLIGFVEGRRDLADPEDAEALFPVIGQ
jgi:hypothetical protein